MGLKTMHLFACDVCGDEKILGPDINPWSVVYTIRITDGHERRMIRDYVCKSCRDNFLDSLENSRINFLDDPKYKGEQDVK